jgi:S-(hydroxymethyl)glutathione dehydrogenase/alcohol dehydrogenase
MASKKTVSRRNVLKKAAAAVGGGAAAGLLGGGVAAAQAPTRAPAVLTGTQAGRRFRAFMTFDNAPNTSIQAAKSSVETVTMRALHEDRIVVRTQAAQV